MSEGIVALGMYTAGPGTDDRFWAGLRRQLENTGVFADLPRRVLPEDQERAWGDERLFLAQTCGYPLTTSLAGKLRYVGTPIYRVNGTEGANYASAIVVRERDEARTLADLRGRRAAYNSEHSQSGYNGFRLAVSELAGGAPYFSQVLATGSHAASLHQIIEGEADVAAIDPIVLALQPLAVRQSVRTIGWTEPAPGLPFVTSLRRSETELAALRSALTLYLGSAEAQQDLPLTGFVTLAPEAYQIIPEQEKRAKARGYPALV